MSAQTTVADACVFLCFSEPATSTTSTAIKWCAVGRAETDKCDTWSVNSLIDDSTAIECQTGNTVEDCMTKIMVKDSPVKMWESSAGFRVVLSLILCSVNHPAA